MQYSEYKTFSENYISKISGDNLFFWNLWCANFLFKNVNKDNLNLKNLEVFSNLESILKSLWKLYKKQIDVKDFLNNENTNYLLNLGDDIYEDLDDFDIDEVAIRELISSIENMIFDLKEDGEISYNASESTMNLIDVIADGISIEKENTNQVFLDEVNAQQKLAQELIEKNKEYTISDIDLYRSAK